MNGVIASSASVSSSTQLGDGYIIDDFALLGQRCDPFSDKPPEILVVGPNSRIRSHTVIYEGNKIGARFQTGHGVLVREHNLIGDDVSIGSHTVIEHHVTIHRGARVHSNCFIPEYCVLGEECWIGPCVVMTNARYPKSPNAKQNLKGVIIEKAAKIGAGAVLLPGVRIGEGALVGSGCVVTHDVAAFSVMVGNPMRKIKSLHDIDDYSQNTP